MIKFYHNTKKFKPYLERTNVHDEMSINLQTKQTKIKRLMHLSKK